MEYNGIFAVQEPGKNNHIHQVWGIHPVREKNKSADAQNCDSYLHWETTAAHAAEWS